MAIASPVSRSVTVRLLSCSATPTLACCQAMGTEYLLDFQEMSPVLSARRVWTVAARVVKLAGDRYGTKSWRPSRSAERAVGQDGVSTDHFRWSPQYYKKNTINN